MIATIPGNLMQQLSLCLDAELGLHFPRSRWMDLERGIRAATQELGFEDPAECAEWLVSTRLTKQQLETLAAHLTIGETYFFRDPAMFDFLATHVLPELIRARRDTGRHIRIWSAGCCTGEEPYSIAMTLARLLPDIADWRITILATDVNPRFLKKAAEGRYGAWSFRGASEPARARYFHRMQDDTSEISLQLRRMVTFAALNLAEDVYPSLITNTNAMDVIFCRNVLMYFSRAHARKVAAKLHASLMDGGWLFPSPAEVSMDVFPQFEMVREPGVLVFRKHGTPPAHPPAPLRPPEIAPARIPAPKRATVAPGSKAEEKIASSADIGLARRLANEGRLDEALAECERAISAHRLLAAGHYLRGVILQERGALAEARVALRRALFLDPDFIVAHFSLGNLLRQQGRATDAARSFENARELLQRCAPDAELPESDGVTAGRLLAMVESIEDVPV